MRIIGARERLDVFGRKIVAIRAQSDKLHDAVDDGIIQ